MLLRLISLNPEAGQLQATKSIVAIISGDSNGLEILRSQFGITNGILIDQGAKDISLNSYSSREQVLRALDLYLRKTVAENECL